MYNSVRYKLWNQSESLNNHNQNTERIIEWGIKVVKWPSISIFCSQDELEVDNYMSDTPFYIV